MAVKLLIDNISFSYGETEAIDGVTIEVKRGEIVSLVGANGAGKSTLLKCIDRILRPRRGVVSLDGRDIAKIGSREISKSIGYIPQQTGDVFPFTIFDVVLMGRRPHLDWRVSRRDIDIVTRTLGYLGIEEFGPRYFDELSGGEKQKVLMARALAQEPEVLLLDEPTSNLDIRHQLEVMTIIRGLVRERGISVVMALHDLNLAARFSEKMVMLRNHQVFRTGPVAEILNVENIRAVYGVEARIGDDHDGIPYVVPLSPVDNPWREQT